MDILGRHFTEGIAQKRRRARLMLRTAATASPRFGLRRVFDFNFAVEMDNNAIVIMLALIAVVMAGPS